MTNSGEFSRRHFLSTTALVTVGAAAGPMGCVSGGAAAIGGFAASAGKELILEFGIPMLLTEALDPVYNWLSDMFADEPKFSPGEMLPKKKVRVSDPVQSVHSESYSREPHFRGITSTELLISPVIGLDKTHQPRIQLSVVKNPSGWSLATGGRDGSQVHSIQNTWIDWWIRKDTCQLRFASRTQLVRCKGCRLALTRQRFYMPDGKVKVLQFPRRKSTLSPELLAKHRQHAPLFDGCDTEEIDVPEQCDEELE